jgi:hypothetical protein
MMSDAKFASITAALLARKGEAAPSLIGAAMHSVPVYEPAPPVRPVRRHQRAPVAADRKRRVVVTLSGEEYTRLGIIAAKKNSTRHDLVRDVLFEQLDAYARTEASDCRCVNSDQPCDCASSSSDGDDAAAQIPALGAA